MTFSFRLAALCVSSLVSCAIYGQSAPFVVRCGLAAAPAKLEEPGGKLLADAPFSARRGYGFIGGQSGRLRRGAVRGDTSGWPIAWRQGDLKYSFRLPRGRYILELGFVETEVSTAGLRVFDVLVEDKRVLTAVDIFAQARDFTWLERSVEVGVFDGWLDLRLVGVTGDRPPRLSRIAVRPYREVEGSPPSPSVPALSGSTGPKRNDLHWTARASGASSDSQSVVGYGVFRSDHVDGPYESLTETPVHSRFFRDERVESGVTYHYKVRAYGIEGGQSPLSEPVSLTAENLVFRGLKSYDFAVSPEALAKISVAGSDDVEERVASAELVFRDRRYPVALGYAGDDERWQVRKSLRIDMSMDRFRLFRKRADLVLSAEAGDWTQLRELLSADVAAALGLAAPTVEPVVLLFNGRHVGLRFDVEDVDSKFRKRVRIDRVGLLARLSDDDQWRPDWKPRGERVGKNGDIVALTQLMQEVNRLHPGEIEDFFATYLYTDRFIDRLAFAALRGEIDPPVDSLYLLRDSRNGRWEIFRHRHSNGDWGIYDWDREVRAPDEDVLDRVLFPLSQREGAAHRSDSLVLLSRFFHSDLFRQRYLERLRKMIDEDLPPERFDEIVDAAFARIRESVLDEPDLWPFDGGTSFLSGPEAIKKAHRLRVAALRERVAEELERRPEPLKIERFLLDPSEGAPWIEFRNSSSDPVDLSKYRLSESFDRSARVIATRTSIAPGRVYRAPLPTAPERPSRAAGGVWVLWRQDSPGRYVVADFQFYGHQTRDLAYGRDQEIASGWRFFPLSTGGEEPKPLASPTAFYRSKVSANRAGDLTVTFQSRGPRPEGPAKIARVELRYRDAGAKEFQSVPMTWDEKRFEYSLALEANEKRPRTEYYFVATSESGVERAYPLGSPDTTLVLPVIPRVRINEVCPRPGALPDSPGEFIELHNDSDEPVSIQGYHLTDDARRPTKWRITEDIVLKPKGYVVFYADGLNRGRHTSFKLSNSGEFIGLFGRVEEGVLKIDSAAFRGVPLGHSWGRKQDGTRSFRAWKDPTPGSRNLPKIPKEILEKERQKRREEKLREQEKQASDDEEQQDR